MNGAIEGDDEPSARAVVGALADDDCQAIVEFLDAPATAGEIAEGTDIPLSTTYRKLDRLVDVGLLAEGTDTLRRGQPTTRYRRAFERIGLHTDESGGLSVVVERPSRAADERLADLWTELRAETGGTM